MPDRDGLSTLLSHCRRPARFLYGTPLQLRIELNPPRRGDTVALTEQSIEVLKGMTQADA